jgi:hypothetical protein
MNCKHYQCLLCGELHETPQEAEKCCQSYVELPACSNCEDKFEVTLN